MSAAFNVAIVGAGVIGRLIALRGAGMGWRVTLFDKGDESARHATSFLPPAMLSPVCERDVAEDIVADLGTASLSLWEKFAVQHGVFFQRNGSLIVGHPRDRAETARFTASLNTKAGAEKFARVSGADLFALEPELDRQFVEGLYVPGEGQIDSRATLAALGKALAAAGVICRFNTAVHSVAPKNIVSTQGKEIFDLVIDARGYGAHDDMRDLRVVRGELVRLHAPDVKFNRPVRLLHPRFPIYIVPQPEGRYVIGATSIESEDDSPMSVRSALELLSAAFALNAAFGEARIIETAVGMRPAFPDNLPRIETTEGLIRVNGLYRHGYMISPKLAELVCTLANTGAVEPAFAPLLRSAA